MYQVLNSSGVELLADGIVEVLEKVGIMCQNDEILMAYAEAGCRVDFESQIARFPRKIILDFVDGIRSEDKKNWESSLTGENKQTIYSGYHPYSEIDRFISPEDPYMFHNLSTYFYDDYTNERRPGNKEDFITMIKLGDAIHPQKGVGHALNLMDTNSEAEPIEAALVELEYSKNPRGVYVHNIRQIPYLQEIEQIFGITDPYWHWIANICPNSPLKLDKVVCERLVYMSKTSIYPAKLAAMPVAGVNMPITVAGAAVIVSAEFIAVWFAMRLISGKKIPLTGMPIQGCMDLKTGKVSFTAFDAAISRITVCDFMKKWMGIPMAPGPGEWNPTKKPSLYGVLEKAYFAMIGAAFTGYHAEIGVGHIDSGLTFSPVQLLLDIEFSQGLKFLESPLINKDTLGIQTILDMGFAITDNYATTEHTLKHMRTSSWIPSLLPRNGWDDEVEREAIKRAKGKVKEYIASYKKPEGTEEKLIKARQVLARAYKEFSVHK